MSGMVEAFLVLLLAAAPEASAPPAPPAAPSAPWLGILFGDALDGGIQVVAVVPGGPAERAGLRGGDLLVAIDGRDTPDRAALDAAVRALRPEEAVAVRLIRNGKVEKRTFRTTAARPSVWRIPDPDLPVAGIGLDFAGIESTEIPPELRRHLGAPENAGILVTRVEAESEGEAAGVRVGDVLVRLDGRELRSAADPFRVFAFGSRGNAVIEAIRSGKPVRMELRREPPFQEALRDAERERLEAERERLREELRRVETEIERLRREER